MAAQLRNLGPHLVLPNKTGPYKNNWLSLERTVNGDTPLCYGATGTVGSLTNAATNYVTWTENAGVNISDPFRMLGFMNGTYIRIPWDGLYDFYIDWQITDALAANCELGFPLEQAATSDTGYGAISFAQFAYDSKTFIETTVDNHFHAFYRGVQFNKDDLVRAGVKTNYVSAALNGITVVSSDFRWTRPIPNRGTFAGGGPLVLVDSTAHHNDGVYRTNGQVLWSQTGLVSGDTSVYLGPGAGIPNGAIAPFTAGTVDTSWWALGWTLPAYGAGRQTQNLLEFYNALNVNSFYELLWFNSASSPLFQLTKQAAGSTLFNSINSTPVSNAKHMWGIVYKTSTNQIFCYVDGALFDTIASGAVSTTPFTDSPNTFGLGIGNAFGGGGSDIYDEVAFGSGTISTAQILNVFNQAAVSFAAYSAAVLALSPQSYYHLDEVY